MLKQSYLWSLVVVSSLAYSDNGFVQVKYAEQESGCVQTLPFELTPQVAVGRAAIANTGKPLGQCFELSFTGAERYLNRSIRANALAEKSKKLIVKVEQYSSTAVNHQFEILLPAQIKKTENPNTCFSKTDLNATTLNPIAEIITHCENETSGELSSGHLSQLKQCVVERCKTQLTSDELVKSCLWQADWFELAQSPEVEYHLINCPSALINDAGHQKTPTTPAKIASNIATENALPNEGVATHFEVFGYPYGGCGVPEALLETPYFVALNVYHSPNWYEFPVRPLNGNDLQYMGEYKNGYNCGRWLEVTIEENCIGGYNGGEPGRAMCGEGGQWIADEYSGAKLHMLVGDSCGDNNAWCRDSRYHLDLATSSLNNFVKNGVPIGDLYPKHWNNRKISWSYVKAPNYSGDLAVYFMQGAGRYWPTILVNQLENGVHGVERWIDGKWVSAERNSDMGQSFILPVNNDDEFKIRVLDASGNYVNNGRVYRFKIPKTCIEKCEPPATLVEFLTQEHDADLDIPFEELAAATLGSEQNDSSQDEKNVTNPPLAETDAGTPTDEQNGMVDSVINEGSGSNPDSSTQPSGATTESENSVQQPTNRMSIGSMPVSFMGLLIGLLFCRRPLLSHS